MKKAIIIIITILVILGGAFAGLWFFTGVLDFLKPSANEFSVQAKKLIGVENGSYKEYEEKINKLKTKKESYTTNMNISANVYLPSMFVDSQTQKNINSTTIKYAGSYDVDKNLNYMNVGLYNEGSELLTVGTTVKDNSIVLNCKDLYDKSIALDYTKYEDFCKNNKIEYDESAKSKMEAFVKMQSYIQSEDIQNLMYNLAYISEDDYKTLDKNYGNVLKDLINKKNYSTKKNQTVTIDGEEFKADAYNLVMNGKDSYKFLEDFLKRVKKDSTFKTLLADKYSIVEKYKNMLPTEDVNSLKFSEDDIEKYIDELLEALKKSEDNFDKNKSIRATIYSKDGNPIRLEISVLEDKDDEGTMIFEYDKAEGKDIYSFNLKELSKLLPNGDNSSSNLSSYKLDNSGLSTSFGSISNITSSMGSIIDSYTGLTIEDKYENGDNSRKGTVKIYLKGSSRGREEAFSVDYDIVNSKTEFKVDLTMSSKIISGVSVNYLYHVSDLDKDIKNIKLELSGKLSIYSAKITAEGTITTGRAEIPEVVNNDSVDLFALSGAEYETVRNDIQRKASEVIPNKLSKLGIKLDDIIKIPEVIKPAEPVV